MCAAIEATAGRPPIRFAGSELGEKRHICAFFNSPEEEYRVLLPFRRAWSAATRPSMWSIRV
jgi:hypothetical protein